MSRTLQVLVTVPNIVRNASGEPIRKRGQSVESLDMLLPATPITHSQLRKHTEAEIELTGLQVACLQADVYLGSQLLASYVPVRK